MQCGVPSAQDHDVTKEFGNSTKAVLPGLSRSTREIANSLIKTRNFRRSGGQKILLGTGHVIRLVCNEHTNLPYSYVATTTELNCLSAGLPENSNLADLHIPTFGSDSGSSESILLNVVTPLQLVFDDFSIIPQPTVKTAKIHGVSKAEAGRKRSLKSTLQSVKIPKRVYFR